MIRDFIYNPNDLELQKVLKSFGIKIENKEHPFAILRLESLTADLFMFRLLVNKNIYYMYAEDYIPNLEYVKELFYKYLQTTKWNFIKPKNPSNSKNIYNYAVKSGYDLFFLLNLLKKFLMHCFLIMHQVVLNYLNNQSLLIS